MDGDVLLVDVEDVKAATSLGGRRFRNVTWE